MAFNEKLCDERHDKIDAYMERTTVALEGLQVSLINVQERFVKVAVGVLASAFVIFAGTIVGLCIYIWSLYHPVIQTVVTAVTH